MYDVVLTPGDSFSGYIDETGVRGTALLGFRVTPVLQDGQTYEEAMGGLTMTYFFDGNFAQGQAGANPKFQGQVTLSVVDGSARELVNATHLTFSTWLEGQTYIISILEYPGEHFLPDDAGAFASGGGNNPALVTTTDVTDVPGASPTTSPLDGASIAGATGVRTYFAAPTGHSWVDGGAILAYRYFLGALWVRCPVNDQSVPAGTAALGNGAIFGLPDMQLLVGTPNERICFIAAAAALSAGATEFGCTYEVQQ